MNYCSTVKVNLENGTVFENDIRDCQIMKSWLGKIIDLDQKIAMKLLYY